ncbi:hypothetical protein ACUH78_18665 [Thauera sp. ZXT1-4]|uniref:hypothetical protein n=1 Tax=Thauera sp. ZXT1-4 TaxID=3460294 RepID=UPI0040409223
MIESMEDLVAELRKEYVSAFSGHFESAEGKPFYRADLIMFGLIDRNIGLLEALPPLFESYNIHALAPLLRVQLDGLLRLHAFRIVQNREDLARHVIKGSKLRNFKANDGKPLTDHYLVSSLKEELPWVESMYDTLCGWVHFSESHVFTAASEGAEEGKVEIGIGSFRQPIKPELFEEAKAATVAIHKATTKIIHDYFALERSV